MNLLGFDRNAFGICLTIISLAGCGALPLSWSKGQDDMQPPIGPSATRQSVTPFSAGGLTSNYATVFVFNGRDGAAPSAPVTVLQGTLYGTTWAGGGGCGKTGCGTLFSVTLGGTHRVLHRFGGNQQTLPRGLTVLNGTLYGTTDHGGSGCNGEGCGTVFSLTPAGAERVIYLFKSPPDGQNPNGLTALNGKLYGTTASGGSAGGGTVYSITSTGKERVLYSFKGGSDGAGPGAPLTVLNGTFYGTTGYGGRSGCSGGCGTVFSVSTAGKERVLYDFPDIPKGVGPVPGPLTAYSRVLYGTTYYGGGTGCFVTCGTAFSITTAGKEQLLHAFQGAPSDGQYPLGLTVLNGVLYGTTEFGGSDKSGTIFGLTTAGSENVLYNFSHPNGRYPAAPLTRLNGTLYGTTHNGGVSSRHGTAFAFNP